MGSASFLLEDLLLIIVPFFLSQFTRSNKMNLNRNDSFERKGKQESFLRKSTAFLNSLPKIFFNQASENESLDKRDSMNITGVVPGTFKQGASFKIDNEGNLDLGSVPPEFQEIVQQLWEKVKAPKFCISDHDDGGDTVQRRKGPRVDKGMKDEEILLLMRSLVNVGTPWDKYKKVRHLIM